MKTEPKVSVVIPTYNYAHFLDECIQSVLQQTFTDFELVIVDNCSTDNTDAVVEKYRADKRVRYYKNAENIGLVGNWNKCLEYAQGTYIKFLLADDKFHPQLLEKFTAVFDAHPGVSVVASNKEEFGLSDSKWIVPFRYEQDGKQVIYTTLTDRNWLGEPTMVMIRRENLKLGLFRDFEWLVDWEFWIRHLMVGNCYVIPEVLCYVRNHSGQVTKKNYKTYINHFEEYELVKKIKETNEYGLDFSVLDIDAVIQTKATEFGRVVPKLMLQSHHADSRRRLKKALKILLREKVMLNALKLHLYIALSKVAPWRFSSRLPVRQRFITNPN